eukprot:Colp12_sorted_trinity150504_noHs@24522
MLYVGRGGLVEKIGEFCMIFRDDINMSMYEWEAHVDNPRYLIPKPTAKSLQVSPDPLVPNLSGSGLVPLSQLKIPAVRPMPKATDQPVADTASTATKGPHMRPHSGPAGGPTGRPGPRPMHPSNRPKK